VSAPQPGPDLRELERELERHLKGFEETQDAKLLALAVSVDVTREQLEEQVRRRFEELEEATARELFLAHNAVGELANLVVR
jgi:hypothetical protein